MTVDTEQSAIIFTGIIDGVACNVPFPVQDETELKVRYGGLDDLATLNVDYSVTLDAPDYETAVVTPLTGFAALSEGTISVRREVPYTQPTDIPTLASLATARVEQLFDRLTFTCQQLRDQLAYALKFPTTDAESTFSLLPAASVRALKYLGFNIAGEPIAIAAPGGGEIVETVIYSVTSLNAVAALGVRPAVVSVAGTTGGFFDWNAASTQTADGVLVINPPVGDAGRYVRRFTGSPKAAWWGVIKSPTNSRVALQTAMDAAVAAGYASLEIDVDGPVVVSGGVLVKPPALTLHGVPGGRTELVSCTMTCTGTAGVEVALAAPYLAGVSTLVFDATGFSVGSVIQIQSCINSKSVGAGVLQSGPTDGEFAFIGEFAQIDSISGTTVGLKGRTRYPYSDTPTGDSGARTASTVRLVTPATGHINDIKFTGRHTNGDPVLDVTYAYDVNFDGCTFYGEGDAGPHINLNKCWKVTGENWKMKRWGYIRLLAAFGGALGANWNSLKMIGCQDVAFSKGEIDGSYQGWDPTYAAGATEGAWSSSCKLYDTVIRNCMDGIAPHDGTIDCEAKRLDIGGCNRGVRIRGLKFNLKNCKLDGRGASSTVGVWLMDGYCHGFDVSENDITGFFSGIRLEYDGNEIPAVPMNGRIGPNTLIEQTSIGVYVMANAASAQIGAVSIAPQVILKPGVRGIYIDQYANGVHIQGKSTVLGPFTGAGRACIEFAANVTNITIDGVVSVNAGVSIATVRGGGNTNQITDAVTYPSGNPEAKMSIGACEIVGDSAGLSSLCTTEAAYNMVGVQRHGVSVDRGRSVTRRYSGTGNIIEAQETDESVLFGVSYEGKLTGDTPDAVKTAVAAAADVAALKTALAGLFA